MSKIVCMIHPQPPLVYFGNEIHSKHPVSLVIVEIRHTSRIKNVVRRIQSCFAMRTLEPLGFRFPLRVADRQKVEVLNRFFGDAWKNLFPDLRVMVTDDINSRDVQEELNEEKPDVVLVHGTSIVKDHILECAPLVLNLHWGLSPYYRGTHCTEWALVNWDPYNIGVTIHRLSNAIDGGDIVAQARAEIAAGDGLHSINMQLTKLGTELMVRALDQIAAGKGLTFHRQDHARGFLTLNRQWSRPLRRQVQHIVRNGLIAKMLEKPARKERLPIVELS